MILQVTVLKMCDQTFKTTTVYVFSLVAVLIMTIVSVIKAEAA